MYGNKTEIIDLKSMNIMKDNLEFCIRKSDCSNLEELIELSKTYYSDGDIIKKEYLNWQYLENPSGKPFLFISKELITNALAGQYLVIPLKFGILKEIVLGSLSLNTLTSPKFQGRGLFTKMAKATYEDCAKNNAFFTIGFPNPQSYPGFVKNLNFEHLGDIPLLVKPLKYGKILFSYFKKNKAKHGGTIKLDTITNANIKLFDFNDEETEEKYNTFWNSANQQYTVSIDKNFTFLNWRYNEIPTRKYKLFYFEEDNIIKGIIILKAEHVWGFNVGIIMDILVLDNNLQVGKKLLKHSKKIFKKANLDFITGLHSNSNEYVIFKKSNYFKIPQKILPQKIHFIVRKNKEFPNSELLFDLKNWKLTFGDYDVF